ncbi:MAG: hypothetical protein M3290_04155 [Actinomycetota bacterium]|nr:hypothetical protein [Actinomycetota bacterium]
MTIRLMISFSQSGGTLLNQCLGSLPRTVVMSEVNPLGGGSGGRARELRTIKEQAQEWYGIQLSSDDFVAGAVELDDICEASGRYLIVRDWTQVNFMPYPANTGTPPRRLLSLESLREHRDVIAFALVRDVIDVWISKGAPAPETFFPFYLDYAQAILAAGIPIFRYESLVDAPRSFMQSLCATLQIQFSDAFLDYGSFQTVNGSVQITTRGARQGAIRALPRRRIARSLATAVDSSREMREANRLLGYATSYASRDLERLPTMMRRRTEDFIDQRVKPRARRVSALLRGQ